MVSERRPSGRLFALRQQDPLPPVFVQSLQGRDDSGGLRVVITYLTQVVGRAMFIVGFGEIASAGKNTANMFSAQVFTRLIMIGAVHASIPFYRPKN